jgi:Uncharacterized conserved protein
MLLKEKEGTPMFRMIDGIPVWGEHDEGTIEQIKRCASDREAVKAALMADGHLGYSMPIGGVVAYRDAVSPSGVGYDISCGIKGVRTNLRADDIRKDIKRIMDQVAREVVFGLGGTSGKAADHPLFDDPTWRDLPQSANCASWRVSNSVRLVQQPLGRYS